MENAPNLPDPFDPSSNPSPEQLSFKTKCLRGSNIVAEWSTGGEIPHEIDSLIAHSCHIHFDLSFKGSENICSLTDIIEAAYRFGFDQGQRI
jgi:hypothetical protein